MNKYVRLGVTALLMAWIGWKTDWAAVGQAFANLNVAFWLGAALVLVVSQMVSALRWRIFASQLGIDRGFWQLTGIYFVGMYFNLLLPTSVGGDVVRVWYLDANSGRKLRAAAAVMLDRVNGLIVLVAMACVAVLFAPEGTPAWVPFSVYGIAGAGAAGVLALAAIVRWGRLNETRKQQVALMWEIIRQPASLVATTGLSLVVQLCSATMVWLVGEGLNAGIPFSYYAVFVPMVSLLTLLPLSVNGMGVREWGCAFFLAPLGISQTLAFTVAFLWFAVQVAVSLAGGLVYLCAAQALGPKTGPTVGPMTTQEEAQNGRVDRHSDQGREGQSRRAA